MVAQYIAGATIAEVAAATFWSAETVRDVLHRRRVNIAPKAGRRARRPGVLSAQERRVVTLIACGLESREIADVLGIAYDTVRTYVRKAMIPLDARNRAHLAALAMIHQQVDPDVVARYRPGVTDPTAARVAP